MSAEPKRKIPQNKIKKRSPAAYVWFNKAIRPNLNLQNPAASFGIISGLISRQWKRMSIEEKAPYFEQAREAQLCFDQIKTQEQAENSKTLKRKRSCNAFFIFCRRNRRRTQEHLRTTNGRVIQRRLATLWHDASTKEREDCWREANQKSSSESTMAAEEAIDTKAELVEEDDDEKDESNETENSEEEAAGEDEDSEIEHHDVEDDEEEEEMEDTAEAPVQESR